MSSRGLTLGDLGERRILADVVFPRIGKTTYGGVHLGDDAAELPNPPAADVVTMISIDPCPTPIVWASVDDDYWHYGRMTAVIGLSDMAAVGATDTSVVVSSIMPREMPVADFDRFLKGLCDACDEWDTAVLGGNIREGDVFQATCAATGSVRASSRLRRVGARPGDHVFVIGDMGAFWAALLAAWKLDEDPRSASPVLRDALFRPRPKLKEGALLAGSGLVSACMDASDGVGACLLTIAEENRVRVVVDEERVVLSPDVRRVAAALGIDPVKLMLSWGNWELVFTVPEKNVPRLRSLLDLHGIAGREIGRLETSYPQVMLRRDGRNQPLRYFGSDRFTEDSYISAGIETYVAALLDHTLLESG